jgi:hypothetical protein
MFDSNENKIRLTQSKNQNIRIFLIFKLFSLNQNHKNRTDARAENVSFQSREILDFLLVNLRQFASRSNLFCDSFVQNLIVNAVIFS